MQDRTFYPSPQVPENAKSVSVDLAKIKSVDFLASLNQNHIIVETGSQEQDEH